MEATEDYPTSMDKGSEKQNFDFSKHEESGNEVQDLLKKLSSWSEDRRASQNRLDDLLSSCSDRVDKGMNALKEEVRDLKDELSEVTKEKNDLQDSNRMLEIVNKDRNNLLEDLNREVTGLELRVSNVTKENNDLQDTNKKLDIRIKEKDKFQMDLTREVTGLQLKLSEVTRERSYLQETVHKLNEELRVQEDKFSQMKALLISNEEQTVGPKDKEQQEAQERESKIVQQQEGFSDIGSSINNWDELSLVEAKAIVEAVATTEVVRTTEHNDMDANSTKEDNVGKTEQENGKEIIPKCDDLTKEVEVDTAQTNFSEEKSRQEDNEMPTDNNSTLKTSKNMLKPFIKASGGRLNRHQAVAKKEAKLPSPVVKLSKLLYCPECGHVTNTINNLNLHMKSVHKKKDKSFKCDKCPHASNTKCDLTKHIQMRHEPKNITCSDCGSAFSRNQYLETHIKNVHKNRGKFKCDKCAYTSSTHDSLKAHRERVHEKIKKYACKGCKFAGYQEKELKNHIKYVHAKIRDQECKICGESFTLRGVLNAHIKTVHANIKEEDIEGKPLVCGKCNFSSGNKIELRRHVLQECVKSKNDNSHK